MTKIDFMVALLSNLQGVFGGTALVIGLVVAALTVGWFVNWHDHMEWETLDTASLSGHDRRMMERDRKRMEVFRASARRLLPVFLLSLAIAVLPDPQQMWETRIALIKFQLASPENVKAGVEHIDTIVKGLECKYLGACGEKKKEEGK